METFNYFNYFTEIEEYFWRKRGAHLLVSPLDWAIVETWQKAGVPLEAVLKGIDRAFESWSRSRRAAGGRQLKSLAYCVDAVLDAAEEASATPTPYSAFFAAQNSSRTGASPPPAIKPSTSTASSRAISSPSPTSSRGEIGGVIISSVVPPLNSTLAGMAERYFSKKALFVEPGIKTGMPVQYDNPQEVGADRIVNSVAAFDKYGGAVHRGGFRHRD